MTLFEVANGLFDSVVAHYADEMADLPERRYISDGLIARDCEQFVVQIARTYSGTPTALATGATSGLATRTAVLRAEIARCSPVTGDSGSPPSPEAIMQSADLIHSDHDDLIDAARKFAKDSGCDPIAVGDATPFGPEGGIAGWAVEVRAQIG